MYKYRIATCIQCGKTFSGNFGPKRMFCSIKCRQLYRNDSSRNPAKTPKARAKISASRKGKPTTLGLLCSEEKKRKISKTLTGRKLSQKHIQSIRNAMTSEIRAKISVARKKQKMPSGENHPMWKGGYAKIRQARYNESDYIEWHDKCLERDNYICQYCGARNGMGESIHFQVHHIINYWERPDLAYALDNGITLCKGCHQKAHKGMKRPDMPTYKGKKHLCIVCKTSFLSKHARKYCDSCKELYCCPICGSTNCNHSARKKSKQPLPL